MKVTDWITDYWIAAGPRQHSDSWFQVHRTHDHILLSDGSGNPQWLDSYGGDIK
jgi:hypothetical protein